MLPFLRLQNLTSVVKSRKFSARKKRIKLKSNAEELYASSNNKKKSYVDRFLESRNKHVRIFNKPQQEEGQLIMN